MDTQTTQVPGQEAHEEEVFVFPVSFAQQRLWFLDRLEPGSTFQNSPVAIRIRGPLDVAVLERALDELVHRHETLRTTFSVVDDEPVQVVAPARHTPLPLHDLSAVPAEAREAELRATLDRLTLRPFDLEKGPLFETALVRLGAEDHVLSFAMHHILTDGWSLGVMLREVRTLYEGYLAGEEEPLEPLPLQYADYALWQREYLSGERLQAQIDYWRRHFAGAPPMLELPTDRPRPAMQTYRGAIVPANLPRAQTDALQALARREGATLFMVLLAAWKAVLARHAAQDAVVVGTPIAGRTQEETEGLIGLFINTLALHTDLSGDPTFRQLVGRVREATLGAYAHQDLPFERLVEELKVERSLAHSPVFQVMFVLQNAPSMAGAAALAGTTFEPVDLPQDTEKYDLSLNTGEHPGGVWLNLSYNPDLFDTATAERLLQHLGRVLEAAVEAPDTRLSDLSLLDEGERAQVVSAWNRTERPFEADATLHGLFADVVASSPDAVAVAWGAGEMTYGELDARANHLAHRLVSLGVGPDVPVAISVDRSPELVVAVMAALKAGGAYVPVDPAYPRDRREYMLRDCGAPVVLTRPHLAGDLPETQAQVVLLDDVSIPLSGETMAAPDVPVSPANLAYVIYTSGSTGRPKGVMVPHRGVINLARVQQEVFGIGPGSRVLMFASFSFDAAAMDLFNTLTAGAALHVAPQEALMPGAPLAATLRERAITAALIPPSALAAMDPEAFPALRTVAAGGEACPPEVARRWGEGRLFINAYGPTEITVCATMAPGEDGARRPSIGRPVPNARIYVLDGAMNPVPVGIPGELYVGGVGVTRGYLRRPDLTAERYLPDPFSGDAGGRLYRTGDRVRWLETGELDFLGRVDEQVKVRGFRIELGEIEAVVEAHPAVRRCVVLVRGSGGDARVLAYVVPVSSHDAPTAAALRAHVAERVPDYMVPAAFVVVDDIPLTPNGKIDRRALPEPDLSSRDETFVAASGDVEQGLTEIWKELLGVARVGVNDNFFELGGHSLLLARMQARIRERLGTDVPMVQLFRFPTIRSLAGFLAADGEAEEEASARGQERADARRAARSARRDRSRR
jgi:amino acid adenylation domain-containing protein